MKKFPLIFIIAMLNVYMLFPSKGLPASSYMLPDNLLGVEKIGRNIWVCGEYGRVFHTEDGVYWEYQKTGVDTTLVSICFINENKGFVVGYWGTIITTEDGGKNWKRVLLDKNENYFLSGIHFIDKQRGFIIGEFARLMATKDGGKSWNQILGDDSDFMLNSIDFYDGKYGWAVGEFATVLRSSDSGNTWEKVEIEGVEELTLFGVEIVDKDHIVITGIDGVIILTSDGGNKWKIKKLGNHHIFGAEFISLQEGLIYGAGILYKTENWGETFERKELVPDLKHGFIYRMKEDIAVGSKGNVSVWNGNEMKTRQITKNISRGK